MKPQRGWCPVNKYRTYVLAGDSYPFSLTSAADGTRRSGGRNHCRRFRKANQSDERFPTREDHGMCQSATTPRSIASGELNGKIEGRYHFPRKQITDSSSGKYLLKHNAIVASFSPFARRHNAREERARAHEERARILAAQAMNWNKVRRLSRDATFVQQIKDLSHSGLCQTTHHGIWSVSYRNHIIFGACTDVFHCSNGWHPSRCDELPTSLMKSRSFADAQAWLRSMRHDVGVSNEERPTSLDVRRDLKR
ncbi:unnamed protein product [Sphagnum tenellum]